MTGTSALPVSGLQWQAEVGGEIVALEARNGPNALVAVATEHSVCALFDASGERLAEFDAGVDVPTGLAIHPSDLAVAVTGARGCVLWRRGATLERLSERWCSTARFGPAGDLAVADGRTVMIVRDADLTRHVTDPAPSTVTDLAWMPDGETVAASAYAGVYEFADDRSDPRAVHPYIGSHLAVAVNPNGRWLCSGNQDASVHIWRLPDDDELEMSGYPAKVTRLAFSPSGRWMANNGGPMLTVWDFTGRGPKGRQPRMLTGLKRAVDLDWRPRGDTVLAAVGSEGSVQLWDITGMAAGGTRGAQRLLAAPQARAVRWLDADRVAVGFDGGVLATISTRRQ